MDKYGVLVVDDSAFMRKTIGLIIEASEQFYVIGKARNGLDALEKMERLKPDLITLDIEMPELDGLGTLKAVMKNNPLPVVMISNEEQATLEALELGAVDVVLKSKLIHDGEQSFEHFYKRLDAAVHVKRSKLIAKEPVSVKPKTVPQVKPWNSVQTKLLIIGSSTGGPAALHKILTNLPAAISVPIVIIQHMPPGFTKPLAERFNKACDFTVKEAEHKEVLQNGVVYIAPAGIQTLLQKNEQGQYSIKQKISMAYETLYKPSIDVTLLSIAEEAKADLTVMILTGMGNDGLKGCYEVKKYGGMVLAESEESCIVYGMPKVVINAGLADKQLVLDDISDEIIRIYH